MTARRRYRTLLLAAITSLLVACGPAAGTPVAQTPQPTEPPSPSVSPSGAPSEAPSEAPAGSASPSPSESADNTIPADALVASRVDGLRIRATPGLGGEALGTIDSGAQSLVIDGPERADGLEWYLISGLGIPFGSGCITGPDPTNPYTCPVWLGWAAHTAADGTSLLEEVEPQCADPAGSLDSFASQPRYLYIACYGDEPLTLKGHLIAQPGVGVEDPCPAVPERLRWLGCVLPTFQLVSGSNSGLGLEMTLGPEAGLPGDGGEIMVEGHFDDPAAAECTFGDDPGRSVLECRARFVVTSAGGIVGE
ncbi:MAG: hypothetical protein ACRDFY_04895 [Candidatus Limnocylindria bacterium]